MPHARADVQNGGYLTHRPYPGIHLCLQPVRANNVTEPVSVR